MAELAVSARALASLRQVDRYLRDRSPAAADRVIDEIERTCLMLTEQPGMGSPVPGTRLRQHVTRHYRYRVIYRVVGDVVEVREVMHPRRGG